MKKRYIVLMIVIAVLLVCVGSFFLITKGRVSVKDGVSQNSRIYMSDVKLENGKVSFTVVNKTFYNVGIGEKPDVQKKIDGEWKPFRLYQSINDIGIRVGKFGEITRSFEIDVDERPEELVGEFRLIYGPVLHDIDKATGEQIFSFKDDRTYIIGYLTVTEDMVTGITDELKIHYTDGIRQSALAYIENAQYANGKVTYTVVNEAKRSLSIYHAPVMEKKVNGEWKYVPMCQVSDDDNYTINILENSKRTHRFAVDTTGNDLAGEYRLVFAPERWIYTNPETSEERLVIPQGVTCLVGYLTITE